MVVRDIWHALMLAWKNLFWGSVVGFILSALVGGDKYGTEVFLSFFLPIFLVQSLIIYRANEKYIIDTKNNSFTFPRSDIENSIFAILIGARYWNLMRRKRVALTEIQNVYIDTKRWSTKHKVQSGNYKDGRARFRTDTKKHERFRINITGSFGSANLSFLDRQKRDEVRSALSVAVKEKTGGRNIDRKVSEFS